MDEVKIPSGYEPCPLGLADETTGELVKSEWHLLPKGSTVTTPKAREQRKQFVEEQEKQKQFWRAKENFFFVWRNIDFGDTPPAMVTKLIYLSTYMNYSDNALMIGSRHMVKKDIARVLNVSERNAALFWKAMSPEFISEDDAGGLHLNGTLFRRGYLPKKEHEPYLRMFNKGVRQLYKAANGKSHKQLGYLFEMLPYISVEYNVLCKNPYERNQAAVEPISILEFCNIIGYSPNNLNRLKGIYNSIRFRVEDHQEVFCKFIYDGIHGNDAIICINPNVLYSGSNPGRMDVARIFFHR